jgi:hypothetical protein
MMSGESVEMLRLTSIQLDVLIPEHGSGRRGIKKVGVLEVG